MRATISEKAQISFVLGDDLLSTKNVNPCMLVPAAKSRKTCKTPILINIKDHKLKLNKNKAQYKYLSECNQVPSTANRCENEALNPHITWFPFSQILCILCM